MGHVDFEMALAKSCNGAFGEITRKVGASAMKDYVKKIGLTNSLDINGIKNSKGGHSFFQRMTQLNLVGRESGRQMIS